MTISATFLGSCLISDVFALIRALFKPFSIIGCIPMLDTNTAYVGKQSYNLNDPWKNKKDDLEACRSYCMSVHDAKYFEWKGLEFKNKNGRKACTCKSNYGRKKKQDGVFAGEVKC